MITLEILPSQGFIWNSKMFHWNEKRDIVREKLKGQHTEDDSVIDMSEFFDGDTSYNINQKREIYQDINGQKNHFFLGYDANNLLIELEVHEGLRVTVDHIDMKFGTDIQTYLSQLRAKGHDFNDVETGHYLFETLKISVADAESSGGDGHALSYLYAAQDIEHLMDDEEAVL